MGGWLGRDPGGGDLKSHVDDRGLLLDGRSVAAVVTKRGTPLRFVGGSASSGPQP